MLRRLYFHFFLFNILNYFLIFYIFARVQRDTMAAASIRISRPQHEKTTTTQTETSYMNECRV